MITITYYQLCHLGDEFKQMMGITIALKKMAQDSGKEEMEQLGGMIFIRTPCFRPPETPMHGIV